MGMFSRMNCNSFVKVVCPADDNFLFGVLIVDKETSETLRKIYRKSNIPNHGESHVLIGLSDF